MRFELDSETHDPLDVAAYTIRETNHLVEEFMLLANITVARRITKAFPMFACLRRHPRPSKRQFDQLLAAAASVGVELDVSSSKALADSLDAAVLPDNPHFNKLLRILTTRCMTQAVYFCSGEVGEPEYLHYGLATPIYTHFTSPIRRCVAASSLWFAVVLVRHSRSWRPVSWATASHCVFHLQLR